MSKRIQQVSGGCVLSLNMDDNAASTTVIDNSGYGNNGTFNDAGGDPNTDAHSVAGRISTALEFDGDDDYVLIPDITAVTSGESFSVCAWVLAYDNPDNYWASVASRTDGAVKGYRLTARGTSAHFAIAGDNDWFLTWGTLVADSWNFICGIWDKPNTKNDFFVNGILADSESASYTPTTYTNRHYIGKAPWSSDYWYKGLVDEVRIYNRALDADEIKAHYLGARHLAV